MEGQRRVERAGDFRFEKFEELMDEWQSGGLGVAGPEATLSALQFGQVDELIITGSPPLLKPVQKLPDARELKKQRESASPRRMDGKAQGFRTRPRVTPEDKATETDEEVNH